MDRIPPVSPVRAPRAPTPLAGASGSGSLAIAAAERALTARFPDLQPQLDCPSLARRRHDDLATDSVARGFTSRQLLDLFIEGPGSMDPAREIRSEDFDRVVTQLEYLLSEAYEDSPTFRRLFNYAADTHLHDSRWLLAAGEAFGTIVTERQHEEAGNRWVIGLNCDPFDARGHPGVYACADGPHSFSGVRLYAHEIVRALTRIPDDAEVHPRGAVVEYENLILKEVREDSPARIAYEVPSLPQPGVEEVDFESIDFGSAFEDPVRRAAQEALDRPKDGDIPGAA